MDFGNYTAPWFGLGQMRQMQMTIEDAWQYIYRNELQAYYSTVVSRSLNGVAAGSDMSVAMKQDNTFTEQDGPMNLCLRDQSSSKFSQSPDHLLTAFGRVGITSSEWTRQCQVGGGCTQLSDWRDGFRGALSQTQDSGLVETDTEGISRTSPITPHHTKPISQLTASVSNLPLVSPHTTKAFLTSTPVRGRFGQKTVEVHGLEKCHTRPAPSTGALVRTNSTARSDGRHPTRGGRCTRRRRVGWRGVAMCAACGLVCSGMDQLNLHYAVVHADLLVLEWRLAQYNSTKASKLLFQAQLDRLRSEKSVNHGTLQTHPIQMDVNSHPTNSARSFPKGFDSDREGKLSPCSIIKSTSSFLSPSPPNQASPEMNHPADMCASGSIETRRTPPSEVESSQLERNSTALTIKDEEDREGSRIKGYPCPRCNYTAKWPTELQKHVMVHANTRPFVCSVCSTSYKWSWDLGRHFSNAHPSLLNPYKRLRTTRHGSSSTKQSDVAENGQTVPTTTTN